MKLTKLFVLAALALLAFSCEKPDNSVTPDNPKDEPQEEPAKQELESITITPASGSIEVGKTLTLTVNLVPSDFSREGLVWESSNKAAATVANGVVTAVAKGEADITATLSGKTATCKITVTKTETPSDEWDGETFIDRSSEWSLAFTDKGGWWAFELLTCTAPYHLIKYAQEGDDWFMPYSICHDPVDIARAYQYFCVDVDDSYLQGAVKATLPDLEELVWPDGNGVATGYAFGFNSKKKFTGEYAILKSQAF